LKIEIEFFLYCFEHVIDFKRVFLEIIFEVAVV